MDQRLLLGGCVLVSVFASGFAIAGILTGVVVAPWRFGYTVRVQRDSDPLKFWCCIFFYVWVTVSLLSWAWRDAV